MKNATNQEMIEMMRRASDEIKSLRRQIAVLGPKAEAYDAMCAVIDLLPKRSISMGEDLAWRLDKRIGELEEIQRANGMPQANGVSDERD